MFRDQVFQNTKQQTVDLAVKHVKLVRAKIDEAIARGDRTQWQLEYSPETFSQTEPEFVIEVCNAVQDAWFAGKDKKNERAIIFNLPATVEVATPNNYADQVCLPPFYRSSLAPALTGHMTFTRSSTSADTLKIEKVLSSLCTLTTIEELVSPHPNLV